MHTCSHALTHTQNRVTSYQWGHPLDYDSSFWQSQTSDIAVCLFLILNIYSTFTVAVFQHVPDSLSCKSKHNLRTPLGAELPDEIEAMWKKNFNLNRHDAVNKMQKTNKKVTATGCVTSGGVLRV